MGRIWNYFRKPITVLPKNLFYGRKKQIDLILRVLGYIDILLLPFYGYLSLELLHYNSVAALKGLFENRPIAVSFCITLVYILFFLLWLLCKKGWVAGLIFSSAFIALSLSDYYKFALTGDYLYPWDIFNQSGNVGELLSFLSTPLPWWEWVLIAGFAVAVIFLFVSKPEMPVKAYVRIPIVIIATVFLFSKVNTPEKVKELLNENQLELEDMALQQSNYEENGFIGAFTVNLLSARVTVPENYNRETVDSLLNNYVYIEQDGDFSNPDIIVVLSESFWDVRLLDGVEFSENPLKNYDDIISRENTISGRFFTTAFGGGTVKPEFEVLTGLTSDYLPAGSIPWQYINSNTESYVSVYHDLGYKTVTIHPYTSSFYQRKETYPLIGFDELFFEDSFYGNSDIPVEIDGKQITDKTFAEHIKNYLSNSESPVFVFGISMENHQPYTNKYGNHTITVKSDVLESSVLSDVENYTQGVYHADIALGELVDFIDSRERDTVLVWFGDHLPTLGANYAAYSQSGMIDLNGMTSEMKEKLQSTPYLIYANFELKSDAMLSAGKDNDIASYNLLNALSTLIGSPRTPLMQFLEDYYNVFPYYNVRLFADVFPDSVWEYTKAHSLITYDRTVGKKYSLE